MYYNHMKFSLCSATPSFLQELLGTPYIYLTIFKRTLCPPFRCLHFTDLVHGLEMEKRIQAVNKKCEL